MKTNNSGIDTVITVVRKDSPFLVRFEPSLKKRLMREAGYHDCSVAEVVRTAVRAYLDKAEKQR